MLSARELVYLIFSLAALIVLGYLTLLRFSPLRQSRQKRNSTGQDRNAESMKEKNSSLPQKSNPISKHGSAVANAGLKNSKKEKANSTPSTSSSNASKDRFNGAISDKKNSCNSSISSKENLTVTAVEQNQFHNENTNSDHSNVEFSSDTANEDILTLASLQRRSKPSKYPVTNCSTTSLNLSNSSSVSLIPNTTEKQSSNITSSGSGEFISIKKKEKLLKENNSNNSTNDIDIMTKEDANDSLVLLANPSFKATDIEEESLIASSISGKSSIDATSEWDVASKKGDTIESIKGKVGRLEDECTHYKESYASLSSMYDELKGKYSAIERERGLITSRLSTKISTLENESMALKTANQNLTAELNELRSSADKTAVVSAGLDQYKKQVEEDHQIISELNEQISIAIEQNEILAKKMVAFDLLKAEYESTKGLFLADKAALESEKYQKEQIELRVVELENELNSLAMQLKQLESDKETSSSMQESLESLRMQITQYQAVASTVEEEKTTAKATVSALEASVDTLNASLQEAMMKCALYAKEKEEILLVEQSLEEQLRNANNQLDVLQRERKTFEIQFVEERTRLSSELETTTNLLAAFKNRLKEKEAALNDLRTQLSSSN